MNTSTTKITIHSFMGALRDYRVVTGEEISNYAAKHAFVELVLGRKTALIERIEHKYKTPINKLAAKHVPAENLQITRKNSGGQEGVDYKNMALLDDILDPKFNRTTKGDTYRIALEQGKGYAILNCLIHGDTLHRAYPPKLAPEYRSKNSRLWNGCCLSCKIGFRGRQDLVGHKLVDLENLKNAFLKRIATQNQSAH